MIAGQNADDRAACPLIGWVTLSLAAVLGIGEGREAFGAPQAGSVWSTDSDGDGLTDGYELSMGLSPDDADIDGDGWDDLGEVAHRTDPRYALSVPTGAASSKVSFLYKCSDTSFRVGWFCYEPTGRRPDVTLSGVYFYTDSWFKPRDRGIAMQPYATAHVSVLGTGTRVVFEVGVELPLSVFHSSRRDDVGWHVYVAMSYGRSFVHAGHNVRLVDNELALTFWIPGVQGPNGGLPLPKATFRPIDAPSAAAQWTRDNACYMELDPQQMIMQPELVLSWYPVVRATCEPAPGWMCPTNRCNSGSWSLSHKEWLRFVDPFAVGF